MWSPTISSDELYHHGIKGQKWGVRRYQNPDGTYTNAGRSRYSQIITGPRKGYTSSTTRSLNKKYGSSDSRTKKSAELDKKIQEKYMDDYSHIGKRIAKDLIFSGNMRLTYNMARTMGESKGKAFVRSVFDLNVGALTGMAADTAVSKTIAKSIPEEKRSLGTTAGGFIAGKVAGSMVDKAWANSGTELSLQQRSLRNQYINGPKKKKKQ